MTPREHLIAGAWMARRLAARCQIEATAPYADAEWRARSLSEARRHRQRARDYLADARRIPVTIEYRRAA